MSLRDVENEIDDDDFTYSEEDLNELPSGSSLSENVIAELAANPKKRARRRTFREGRQRQKKHWSELSDKTEFPQVLRDIFRKSVILPRHEFQEKLALIYLLLPAFLCEMIPVVFSHGESGCGKSQMGLLATKLHGTSFVGANSTAASLRNTADSVRKRNKEGSANDRRNELECYSLSWNDIHKDMLASNDYALLTLLKLGVERGSVITKASAEEGNIEFWVFGPKFISSITAFYSDPRFAEMKRRTIVIKHKTLKSFSGDDWDAVNKSIDQSDLIVYRNIEWEGFNDALTDYWDSDEMEDRWDSVSSALDKVAMHGMEQPLFEMSFDMIVCGVITGVFKDIEDGCNHFQEYWSWHRLNVESEYGASMQAIIRYIKAETEEQVTSNQEARDLKLYKLIQPIEIDPASLKTYCNGCAARGELDSYLDDARRADAMRALGWTLGQNKAGQVKWLAPGGG